MEFICTQCSKCFVRSKRNSHHSVKRGGKPFCSKECSYKYSTTKVKLNCTNCGNETVKKNSELSKIKNPFCSKSCAATYNNIHKTTGTRRSKLEIYLESQLISIYPDLEILFNDKTAINSELDIYIPSLKLAFELNGIFHYEPIHGDEKLNQIQNNDQRKFKLCLEHSISLCIIDTSSQKYFKEDSSKKFLDIIISIIDRETTAGRGIKP